MKIVFAATTEQEEVIEQLISNLRSNILPMCVSEMDLKTYTEMGLLQFSRHSHLYNGTLREAYQVMTALQTIIFIIEAVNDDPEVAIIQYLDLYMNNVSIITNFGLFFPFQLCSFQKKGISKEFIPLYSQSINQLIM